MDGHSPEQDERANGRAGLDEELQRRSRVRDVAKRMRDCLNALDDLELWKGGAHLDQALAEVERHL